MPFSTWQSSLIAKGSLILCFGFTPVVSAQFSWQKENKNNQIGDFQLIPHTCVMEKQQTTCTRELTITFSSHFPKAICIYSSLSKQPITCTDTRTKHVVMHSIDSSHDITFTVFDSQSNTEIAKKTLEVTQFRPVTKRIKRQYGIGLL